MGSCAANANGLFESLLTSGMAAELPPDRLRRLRVTNAVIGLACLYLFAVGLGHARLGSPRLAVVNLAMAALLLTALLAMRWLHDDRWPPLFALLGAAAYLAWLFITSHGYATGILWLCMFPTGAVFVLGARLGLVLAVGLYAVCVVGVAAAGQPAALQVHETGVLLRLTMVYGALTGFAVLFEQIRARYEATLDLRNRELESRLAELEAARQAAETANVAKSRFLATMSHELRTPMNGVLGMADLLAISDLPPDLRGHVQTIRGSGRALLEIIEDILDFSRIEAGELRIRKEPFDLQAVAQEVVDLLLPKARDKSIRLELEETDGFRRLRQGDPGRVRQILLNLAGNAVKFTDEGHVKLRVDADGDRVRLTVSDTGGGISDADQARLFQAFSQLDGSRTRRYGGSGLGLAISQQLAQLMNGQVFCVSELGQGSTFIAELELPEALELPQTEISAGPPELPDFQGHRIMLAEDNAVNLTVAMQMLRRFNLEVDVARSGLEAVRKLDASRHDLVLMDIQMPEMDGLQAARSIRSSDITIPIIALTADALPGDRQVCLDAGMNDYLTKPLQLSELARTLQRWLAPEEMR